MLVGSWTAVFPFAVTAHSVSGACGVEYEEKVGICYEYKIHINRNCGVGRCDICTEGTSIRHIWWKKADAGDAGETRQGASGDHHGGTHSVLSEGGGDGSGGNWNTKSRWRSGDRRDIQMEAQYASEYPAGDCELYGDVASGMRKREVEKFHSSEPLF